MLIYIIDGDDEKFKNAEYPKAGDKVTLSYTGRFHGGEDHGVEFERGELENIEIGIGKLIRGWDEGVLKMKYGQTAILKISADYGYGKKGAKGRGKSKDIPPNQDLQFTVTLMGK